MQPGPAAAHAAEQDHGRRPRLSCDPGRALVTGLWTDIGKFRAPPLRGLAARAPYFHDGQAASLKDVIRHYQDRFSLGLTAQQTGDLEAFLKAL